MTTTPRPSPDDRIEFIDAHRPGLRAGEYVLTATLAQSAAQAQALDGKAHTSAVTLATQTSHLYVGAERFRLRKEDIHACHPAPGASGNFHGRLPHVVFHRSTLPWERNPSTDATLAASPPWLALLLFRASEEPTITTVAFSALAPTTPTTPLWRAPLSEEPAQAQDEPISVIDVDARLLHVLLPAWSELPLTAHARVVRRPDGTSDEVAVLLGTRLIEPPEGAQAPSPKTATAWVAHLVSLEECFQAQGAGYVVPGLAADAGGKRRLVTLHHWRFVDREGDDFGPTVEACHGVQQPAPFRMVGPWNGANRTFDPVVLPSGDEPAAIDAANRLLAAGSTPIPYRLRSGDQTVAWFRGPLVAALASDGFVAQLPLPVWSGDELVLFDEATGMFDVSYAVAWELGRLEALADRRFAVAVSQWKRARAQHAARLRVEADSAFLPHVAAQPDLQDFPQVPADFLRELARLGGLPPAHLLPHRGLLPLARPADGPAVGSFRFVDVDPQWVECLVDGALSVGRVTGGDRVRDAQHHRSLPVRTTMKGFLLRSQVVADYPDLAFAGYALGPQGHAGPPLVPVTVRRLAPDTLFVLFDAGTGTLDRVDLHLPAEGMRFGFSLQDFHNTADYAVDLRAPDTGVQVNGVLRPADHDVFRCDDPHSAVRRVALDQLAVALQKALAAPADFATHASALALQLLDGPVRVVITRAAPTLDGSR